jgi:DNA-binding IclR family transcriptional regulator
MAKINSSTLKALDVLELLAGEESGMRLTDVAVSLGFPISTARRLLASLLDRGYVEQDAQTSRYYLGAKILTLQAQGIRQRQVIRLAYPFMKQLQRDLDETVNLGILGDRSVMYVETLAPESSFAFYAPPGTRMPLYCTAMGKLFLAHLNEPALAAALKEIDWKRRTPRTLVTPEELTAQLPEIREQGFAIDNEEYAAGVRCVAAPVMSHAGQPVAAISVTALASRQIGEREATVTRAVTQACARISESLGYARPRA